MKEVKKQYGEEYEETSGEPLTTTEAKHRLKHIAGLCWGLVCDIGRMEVERDELKKRIRELERTLKAEQEKNGTAKPKRTYKRGMTAEEKRLRKAEYNREWRKKKAQESNCTTSDEGGNA